jgi:hypothetical protein
MGDAQQKARPGWETGVLSTASVPSEERVRHWAVDAAIGAAAAAAAIVIAQAVLPDRAQALAQSTPPRPVTRTLAAPPEPAHLVAFSDPVAGREIISPFGLRQLPWEENGRLHEGVDIAAPFGSAVLAAADGVVVDAGRSDTYGRFVRLKHAAGLTTLYAHMGSVADGLAPGQAVKAGHRVGEIGSSGTSTGPHLHFELRDEKDRPLNPGLFLGQTFHAAEELPLRAARRVPRGVRIAWVSRIPESKRELMEAKLLAKTTARDAASAGKNASVTVVYGDGRPHARFNLASAKTPLQTEPEDAPVATAEAPPV